MREKIKAFLKDDTRVVALQLRDKLDLSQYEMSELLEMHRNSYVEIECGTSLCSCVTFVLMLILMEDPLQYILHLKREILALYEKELQPI